MEVTLNKLRLKDSQTLNYVVNKLFEELDTDRIRKVMELLDWKWAIKNPEGTSYTNDIFYRIPTKKDMKDAVHHLLVTGIEQSLYEDGEWTFTGTGGFDIAIRYQDLGTDTCSLEINVGFTLTQADWWNANMKK